MRLAYVCADPGVPVYGSKGCSIHVQEIVSCLAKCGAQVELFASEIGGAVPAMLRDIPLHPLPPIHKGTPESREQAAWAANDQLFSALQAAGPFQAVIERHSLWSYAGVEYAQSMDIPSLLEVNAPLLEEQRQYRTLVDHGQAQQAVNRAYSAASDLLAVSTEVARYLTSTPTVRGRVYVLPNGVDTERFTPECPPTMKCSRGSFTVGFVGGLRPWHGVEDLIDAFATMQHIESEVRLLIVGDGQLRTELEARATRLGIRDSTIFTGKVSPEQIPGLLTSMDVAVAPYPPLDSFYFSPLKLFEYMASGRAIIASSIGQIADVIRHDQTGVLYPPGDLKALVDALIRLRQHPGLRASLGQAARNLALRHHTWTAVAHTILSIARMSTPAPAISQGSPA